MGSTSQNSVYLRHLTQPTAEGSHSLEMSDKYYSMPPKVSVLRMRTLLFSEAR